MRDQCLHFETCSAPLCPMDRKSLENGVWFPEEKVCPRKFGGDAFRWLRQQRKLKARGAALDPDRCFTFGMLVKVARATPQVKGVSPDTDDFPGAVAAWIGRRGSAENMRHGRMPPWMRDTASAESCDAMIDGLAEGSDSDLAPGSDSVAISPVPHLGDDDESKPSVSSEAASRSATTVTSPPDSIANQEAPA